MMEAKLRASGFSSVSGKTSASASASSRRPPEVGGFPGFEHVMPGPFPSAGGALKQTDATVFGQAKGWLSGALKTMADRLDGAGASSAGGGSSVSGASFGIQGGPMAEAENARRRKQWEDAQRGLFLDDRHVSRGRGSGRAPKRTTNRAFTTTNPRAIPMVRAVRVQTTPRRRRGPDSGTCARGTGRRIPPTRSRRPSRAWRAGSGVRPTSAGSTRTRTEDD